MTFLDGEEVKQLDDIARAARRGADVALAQAEPLRAGYAERWPRHRAYAPGDDYRRIDWNVCARHDELLYRPPPPFSDRPVQLLVDCSRSMTTGSPSKWERAVRIAARLGAAALGRLDRVGALGFANGVVAEIPPMRGAARCLRLARFLDQLRPEGKRADLAAASRRLALRGPPGMTVVIGDFFAPDGYCRGLDLLQCAGHAVCAVHVCARDDAQPSLLGNVALCDIETGDRLAAVLGQRELSAYRTAFHEFCDAMRRFCRRRGIAYHRNWEDTPWRWTLFEVMGLVARQPKSG